jgi:COP9 signalosome complex subunit 6
MEKGKDTKQSGAVVEREGAGALTLHLHPLVIINISDHWTRTKVQTNQANPRVIGALVGTQTGRVVEIYNSYELPYSVKDGQVHIDLKFHAQKSEQFKKVFKTYDFLGWYSTGDKVNPADMEVHKQFFEFNESPLYLQLDTVACGTAKELPISIYESELHVIKETPTLLFVKIPYKIETGDAERISVDHIARITPTGGGSSGSLLTAHLMGIHNAISMLHSRIIILTKILEAIKNGKVPKDQGLLRKIATLCNQLPAIDTPTFSRDFINEYNDALMITYLASITKGEGAINELIDKFNVTYERHSRRRGFFG